MARIYWNILIIGGMVLGSVAIAVLVVKVLPTAPIPEGKYLGSKVVQGVATGPPEELDGEAFVYFTLQETEEVEHFARIPRNCADEVGRGTKLSVRIGFWNATGTMFVEPRSPEGYTRIATVECAKRLTSLRD